MIAARLLWAHVSHGSHGAARIGYSDGAGVVVCPARRIGGFRETEIENLYPAFASHQYVVRFQVPMNDSRGMGRRQPVRDLHREIEQLARAIYRSER